MELVLKIILGILVGEYILEQYIEWLNYKKLNTNIPAELQDIFTQEQLEKSVQYQKAKARFGFVSAAFNLILYIAVLVTGMMGRLNIELLVRIEDPIWASLAFFGVLFIVSDLIHIPFQSYKTFVIEQKFGFNKMKAKTFIIDKIKGYALGAIVGGLILYTFLYLVNLFDHNFWIYFWIFITAFMIFMNMFYTSLIVPLFNKLKPLEQGELRSAIEEYAKKVNFPLTNIFVINGSKRSSKANAYFSGLGPRKKIVLFDTLIEKHSQSELVAVLAHEVGHYKKKHIIQGLLISVLQTGLILFILSLFLFSPELTKALGADFSEIPELFPALGSNLESIPLNLIAFGILFSPLSKIIGILMNLFSRKNEYEADAYAAKTYSAGPLQAALKKLTSDHLGNLTPHPAYVFMHYSHPTLLQRLTALNKYSKEMSNVETT